MNRYTPTLGWVLVNSIGWYLIDMMADISLNMKVGYQVICRWTSVVRLSANMLASMSTDSRPRVGGNDCQPIIGH